ncbi:MAG: T9SS type A sorting domain-containing protein, partial [Bacteroidota bacterium]
EPEGDEVEWSWYFSRQMNGGQTPDWTQPAMALNMSMTAKVNVRGSYPDASGHQLAAFHEGELRGVTTARQVGDDWLFFLSIQSDQANDSIYFKYYDAHLQSIFHVSDSIRFISQQIMGSIADPYPLEAGNLNIELNNNTLTASDPAPGWLGNDTLYVIARELNTYDRFADTTAIIFSRTSGPGLPVELLSFTGRPFQNQAELEWSIGHPENVKGYEVNRAWYDERSGQIYWETIGFVPHDDQQSYYTFVDPRPYPGDNYYRLRTVDFDGYYEWSGILTIVFDKQEESFVSIYPNPVLSSQALYISFNTEKEETATLSLIDANGQVWQQATMSTFGIRQAFPIPHQHLPGGSYTVRIVIGHRVHHRHLLLIRD